MATETWIFKDSPYVILYNYSGSVWNINFTCNNVSYSKMEIYHSSYDYLYYGSTLVFDKDDHTGWVNQAYRTVTFETAPSGSLLAFLQENATKQAPRLSVDVSTLAGWANLSAGAHNITIVAKAAGFKDSAPSAAVQVTKAASTKTLAAGTYKWKDTVTLIDIAQDIEFTSNNTQYAIIKSNEGRAVITYTASYNDAVYINGAWTSAAYQTITLATDQQVSADFYEWAITGGNLVKQVVDNGITTDTPAYSFNVDFNVAPGQNVSETSNQAYQAVQNYINETGGSSKYAILGALGAISSELRDAFESVLEFGSNIKNRIRDIGDLQVPSGGNVTLACDVYAVYFGVYNNGSWEVAIPTSSTEGWQTHLSATGSTPIVMVTVTQ